MIVYVDLVFILNTIIDLVLLLTVSMVLKRNVKLYRIFLGSLIGSISTILLFINIDNILLFLMKFVISVLMILTAFSFKSIKYFITNLIYLYLMSILLGGFLYLLNIEAGYKNLGLILISPIILVIYVRNTKKIGINYNYYYLVDLYYQNKVYKFNAFLDTGNKLYDQYKNRPIILINSSKIIFDYEKGILVPYKTTSGSGLLKCIYADKLVINKEKVVTNILAGLSEDSFNIDGVDMILHTDIL